jgi:hypothetical protein
MVFAYANRHLQGHGKLRGCDRARRDKENLANVSKEGESPPFLFALLFSLAT